MLVSGRGGRRAFSSTLSLPVGTGLPERVEERANLDKVPWRTPETVTSGLW